jgi:phage terminase large subunit-like protein
MFDHLVYKRIPWHAIPRLLRTTVWVDPAVTDKDTSDSQGIQADGLGIDGKIYRLYSWEQRTSPQDAIRRALRKAVELEAITLGVETDQGGDTWRSVVDEAKEALRHDPERPCDASGVQFVWDKAGAGHGSKVHRASLMLADYERGGIVHVEGTHAVLERALHRFPKLKPHDLTDAAVWAVKDLRGGTNAVTYSDRWAPSR